MALRLVRSEKHRQLPICSSDTAHLCLWRSNTLHRTHGAGSSCMVSTILEAKPTNTTHRSSKRWPFAGAHHFHKSLGVVLSLTRALLRVSPSKQCGRVTRTPSVNAAQGAGSSIAVDAFVPPNSENDSSHRSIFLPTEPRISNRWYGPQPSWMVGMESVVLPGAEQGYDCE